jgi:diguanylate cyclase (GGDEF)-like protein
MTIDEPTLMTVLGLAALTASAMFFALAAFARQIPGVRYWAFGSLAVGFATLLDGPRLIDDWRLASLLFNVPFSVGQALILAGTMQFCGRPAATRVLWYLALVAVLITVGFTFIRPDATWRICSLSAFQAIINLWTAHILWRFPDRFSRRAFHIASVIALVQASAALAQGVLIAFSALSVSYASPEFPIANIISWAGAMINVLVGNWMMFLLVMLRLVGDLKMAAEHDPLTGLLNRRGLRLHIDSVLRRANGGGRTMGVLILDLDHFKSINDTHGHDTGDRVLVVMGQVLLNLGRPNATPCRWGGEEFCIIVEGPTPAALTDLAEGVRTQFKERSGSVSELSAASTVSIGIALAPLDAAFDMSRIIARADTALYRAKEQGRDQVVLAS